MADDQKEVTRIELDTVTVTLMTAASMQRQMEGLLRTFKKAEKGEFATDREFVDEGQPQAEALVRLFERFGEMIDKRERERVGGEDVSRVV